MYKVAVVGAAGFVGAELVRLILGHPELELVAISSDADAGKELSEVYPSFVGRTSMRFVKHDAVLALASEDLNVVFLAVPHTAALSMAPQFLQNDISVIDLSADFRLKDARIYKAWYGVEHTAAELLPQAVYGLPEVFRCELSALSQTFLEGGSVLVANPGCYPTASVLATFPALQAGLCNLEGVVVIHAISGVSGAGKKANETTHFCMVQDSVNAYGVTTHRHTPEIAQTLSIVAEQAVKVQFTPHLAPLNRGMIATVTLPLKAELMQECSTEFIQNIYKKAYEEESFVKVLPQGKMPKSQSVQYSNRAQVGVAYDATTGLIVASCAIDNLGKGAAAQAVQCANIVLSLEETCGLTLQGGFL